MIQLPVEIPVRNATVKGELVLPDEAHTIVVFAHGSGSSRFSPRNQMVAKYLWQRGFGTLLFDLLTVQEDKNYQTRFNIELLSQRLVEATVWLQERSETKGIYFSYFGASTGAAAALKAASLLTQITAVVSRGGRPDLAIEVLPAVKAPTLLIVGSLDKEVYKLNLKALEKLRCEKQLIEISGASHLFEETGTMEQVCELAANWLQKHLEPAI